MKMDFPCRLVMYAAALALVLWSLTSTSIPCDEACSAEAPTCECACVCYGYEVAIPGSCVLFDMDLARHAGQVESSQRSLLLATDIFRPPIA
jgi:hypothetical protein